MKPFPVRLVLLLMIVASAGYVSRVAVTVAAPGLMHDFGLTQAQMGTVFSAFLLGYTLCQVPSGMLADRQNPRPIFLLLSLAWTLLSALSAFVGWRGFAIGLLLPQLWIIRGVLGVLSAPIYPTAVRLVSVTTPGRLQARASSLVLASVGIGSAITPLVLTPITARWGWRAALLFASTFSAVAALLWWMLAPKHLAAPKHLVSADATSAPGLARSSSFWFLSASYFLQGYLGYIFIFWFYLYLVQVRHMEVLQAAGFTALPWLATMFAIPLGGVFSDLAVAHWSNIGGRRLVPFVALTASAGFLFFGARTPNPLLAVGALTACTVLVLATEGSFWSTMTQLAGPRSGTAGGVMNFGSNLGGFISPSLTPWLAERIGWESALSLTAGLALIAAVLWFGVKPLPLTPLLQSDRLDTSGG